MKSSFCQLYCFSLLLLCVVSCTQEIVVPDVEVCDKSKITSKQVISVEGAKELLSKNSDAILVEVSDPKLYAEEHLPDALNIWRPDFRSKSPTSIKGKKCSKAELENLLSKLGVTDQTTLLVYDRKGAVDALRFMWVLEYYGFQKHLVINGGLTAWKMAGFQTVRDSPLPNSASNFKLKGVEDRSILATMEEVNLAIKDSSTLIIDTREQSEYLGLPFIANNKVVSYKKGASIHGCIPTAIHLNWSDLADLSDDHRIKCEKELRYNLEQIGVSPGHKVIVYCQSGSRSSHTAFVLRHILGFSNVKNYDGSWIEWSQEHVKTGKVAIEQKTEDKEIERLGVHLRTELKEKNG